MGLFDWFKGEGDGGEKHPLDSGSREINPPPERAVEDLHPGPPPAGQVRFLDMPNNRIVLIPADELAPGTVHARLVGVDEPVWVDTRELRRGEVQHPPFPPAVMVHIERIQRSFAEHRDLTVAEWEEEFRRDAYPAREIAIFEHAAVVYEHFAADEPDAARRRGVYYCLVACMNSPAATVRNVIPPTPLSDAELERIIRAYYRPMPEG